MSEQPLQAPAYFPQQCPVCLHDIELKPQNMIRGKNGQMWIFKCPRIRCQAVFSILNQVSDSEESPKIVESPNSQTFLVNQAELKAISPNFVKTIKQANQAERLEMDELYGQAYRKALEYLVKDYLIKFGNLDKSDIQIQRMGLSDAVDKLGDPRLISLAKASTWLGNDQARPVKKHPDYGVSELKKFIQAFSAFCVYSMRAKQAEDFINSGD